jgi:hypothetical protein
VIVTEVLPRAVPLVGAIAVTVGAGAAGFRVSVALTVVVPWPVSVLVKVIVALYVFAARPLALAFTVNVTGVPEDAVPEVEEAVSQVGTPDIEKSTLPLEALSV